MLREEIERRISQGGDAKTLWECLYLKPEETAELLDYIRSAASVPWVHPMAVLAAHTGMRRSELIRARVEDVNCVTGFVTVREKKRRRGRDSTRFVPMSPLLLRSLEPYAASRRGEPLLFGVTLDAAQHHLNQTLKGSKWEVLKGWHVLRHSFVSALASRGIDQRIIDDFTGHTTEEMRRRYRHLFPDVKRQAIADVFG